LIKQTPRFADGYWHDFPEISCDILLQSNLEAGWAGSIDGKDEEIFMCGQPQPNARSSTALPLETVFRLSGLVFGGVSGSDH